MATVQIARRRHRPDRPPPRHALDSFACREGMLAGRFFGIVIGIFPREHPPPHFHAVYGDFHVTVDIESGAVKGEFPRRALRLVEEWRSLHQAELLENWNLLQAGRPAIKIEPLE